MTQDRSAAGDRRTSSTDDVLPSGSAAGRRTAGSASGPGGRPASPAGGSTAVTGPGEPATEVLSTGGRRRGTSTGEPGAAGAAGTTGTTTRAGRADRSGGGPARSASQRRRARLGLVRLDPWSVFVLSLLVSIFLGVVLVVAVAALYGLLSGLGVLGSLDTFARDLQVIKEGQTLVGFGRVLGIAAVLAAVNVVLLTVLATLAAFLYNLCSSITGGLEVVLAERE